MGRAKAAAGVSKAISIQEIGISANGKKLFCIHVSQNKELRQPGNFQSGSEHENIKVPVVVTAAVHGNETCGTEALLQLLEYFSKQEELLRHLDLILAPCVNPDGFDNNTRFNGRGFDLNRDFITQSQSETKAMAGLIACYNPVVLLDLHGYVCKDRYKIGVIEPCTPPHNPVYEYDLYLPSALLMAEYIEGYLLDNKKIFVSKRYKEMTGTFIPFRDMTSGWDDYSPFSIAMYSILHGTVGCTIEAPTNEADCIYWLYFAVLGACEFIINHKQSLLRNHNEFFNRGKEGRHPFHPKGFFPEAYLLRKKTEDEASLIKLVKHLYSNGVSMTKSSNDKYYADLHQPKAVLAHALLWTGEDLSQQPIKMTDLCAWSLPLLWGVQAVPLYNSKKTAAIEMKAIPHCPKEYEKEPSTIHATPFHLASPQKIAIIRDGGLYGKQSHSGAREALTRMGFSVTELHPRKLADKYVLNSFNVFIYNGFEQLFNIAEKMPERYRQYVFESLSQREHGVKNITDFIDAGGLFITIGAGGARVARNFLKLTKVKINVSGWNNNGIVRIHYFPNQLTEGYSEIDIGFVYRPVWFTSKEDTEVAAEYASGPDSLLAGYWPEHPKAEDQAAIISEKNGRVVLIGPEICHRAHPEYLYRLLLNAIHQYI